MSDERINVIPTTKRETLVARAAWVAGHYAPRSPHSDAWSRASDVFPLPKVTQPRELRYRNIGDYDVAFRYVDGEFQSQDVALHCHADPHRWVARRQLPACYFDDLAALKANPTEEVEA
jgi:hypothetical protein